MFFFETSVLFYEQLTNNGRAIGTDEFVHDTLNSNYTILFFILLLDDYYFWYTNILIMYSNCKKIFSINEKFLKRKSNCDMVWSPEES